MRRLVTAADAVLDGTILAFALWTVCYEIALFGRLGAWVTAQVWLPLAVLSVAGTLLLQLRGRAADADVGRDSCSSPAARRMLPVPVGHAVVAVTVVLGLVAAVLAARFTATYDAGESAVEFDAVWRVLLAGVLAALVAAVGVRRRPPAPRAAGAPTDGGGPTDGDDPAEAAARLPGWAHLVAAVLVVALAAAMMYVLNPSADDIYYVNRSVWTAEHGTFALRDTMFGPLTYPDTYGGGLPLASVEGLIGALAHLVGTSAGTMSYLVTQPLGCLLGGWATWRLVRAWAPAAAPVRALLALAGSFATVLWCATGVLGDFGFARLWQGKVLALWVVLPVVWVLLTRLGRAERLRAQLGTVALLLACGVALIGLTPTSVLLAPAVAAAAVLAGLLLRRARVALLAGAVAMVAAPVAGGLVVLLAGPDVGGADPQAQDPARVFARVVGEDPAVVGLVTFALVVAPLLLGSAAARALAACACLASVTVLVPGVMELLNTATGAGPILYRLLLVAPLPVLAGLLVTVPAPRAPGRAGIALRVAVPSALATALVAGLVITGTPVWSGEVGGRLTARPTWKWHLGALPAAVRVAELDPGPGPVLLPPRTMKTLPLLTTETFAVVPRRYYLRGLEESEEAHRQRRGLFWRLAKAETEDDLLTRPRARRALELLDVSLVCLPADDVEALDRVADAGYGQPFDLRGLSCLRRG